MTKMGRRLLAVTIVGALLGAAFMLSGCDDEVAADTSAPIVAATQDATVAFASEPADVDTSSADASSEPSSSEDPASMAQASAGGAAASTQEAALAPIPIEDIIQDPGRYAGTEVMVRGMILTQCMRGCQFSIEDDTGVIGIELVDQALEKLIEQGSVGRLVVARGVIEGETRPRLLVQNSEAWYFDD